MNKRGEEGECEEGLGRESQLQLDHRVGFSILYIKDRLFTYNIYKDSMQN